jgi:hypothetical protein
MVFATKIEHLLLALGGRPIGVPFWDRRRIDQSSFTTFSIGLAPSVKARPANPEIAARLRDVSDLFGISKYP